MALKIFRGIESYSSDKAACVTTGTFDGVHLGHKKILQQLTDMAEGQGQESVLVTFDPHPRSVLFPDQDGLKLLNTLEEKLELLETTGLQSVVVHPFTKAFSRTTALHYVRDLLVNGIGMKRLVIGYDHQFGKNREGSIDQLREFAPLYNFEVVEIPAQDIDDVKVSSTKVRSALMEGAVDTANSYLQYPYFLTGEVVRGASRGRALGFPTANIEVAHPQKLIPKQGVYAVEVKVNEQRYHGMLNIGVNPTFVENGMRTIEVNLFDFDELIYGERVHVYFHGRVRNEMKFDSADALVEQMKMDKMHVRNLFQ